MSFEDLPPMRPLLHPEAIGYAERIVAASKEAMRRLPVRLDVAYGSDYWQKVDLYLPPALPSGADCPVLFYIHGGGWANGCKEWMGFMAPALVDAPLIFVSVSHRLAPAVRMRGIVDDCADALAWVYRHIAGYGGDPDRLFVAGHSAGAHLAALLALRADLGTARGLPVNAVKGCFPMSGTFDLRFALNPVGHVEEHIRDVVLGGTAEIAEWSPWAAVEGNRIPFYVTWGEQDFARIAAQGRQLVEALSRQPGAVEAEVFAAQTHFSVNEACGPAGNTWSRKVKALMARQIKEQGA
jgi:acetyl esterase/lipase